MLTLAVTAPLEASKVDAAEDPLRGEDRVAIPRTEASEDSKEDLDLWRSSRTSPRGGTR